MTFRDPTCRGCHHCEQVEPEQPLMSPDGDTPCESCGRKRPLVEVTFKDGATFRCCVSCAVSAIRSGGHTSAVLGFHVGPEGEG